MERRSIMKRKPNDWLTTGCSAQKQNDAYYGLYHPQSHRRRRCTIARRILHSNYLLRWSSGGALTAMTVVAGDTTCNRGEKGAMHGFRMAFWRRRTHSRSARTFTSARASTIDRRQQLMFCLSFTFAYLQRASTERPATDRAIGRATSYDTVPIRLLPPVCRLSLELLLELRGIQHQYRGVSNDGITQS